MMNPRRSLCAASRIHSHAHRLISTRQPGCSSMPMRLRYSASACVEGGPSTSAGLDEVERLVASEHGGHFIQLTFKELTEQRTGVDAGQKIARATGSPVGAGVVTELGMVKRQLHERGHRHRTAFTDYFNNLHRR